MKLSKSEICEEVGNYLRRNLNEFEFQLICSLDDRDLNEFWDHYNNAKLIK